MTSSIHFFGVFANGYSQFPTDYTQEQYESIIKQARAKVELHVQRRGNIISYSYIRQFSSDSGKQFLGISCEYNGIYVTDINTLFSIFEDEYARCATKGFLLEYDDEGKIISTVSSLYTVEQELQIVSSQIKGCIDEIVNQKSLPLPTENYAISLTEKKILIYNKFNENDFKEAVKQFSNIIIVKDSASAFESESEHSFSTKISKKTAELNEAKERINELNRQLITVKNKQRNTTWVFIFAILAVVLGGVVWNYVLFPSEVTHKQMSDFIYYGPVNNNEPNGVGVALYPKNDPSGRMYYVGGFSEGERNDSIAMLLYRDGSFFLGNIQSDSLRQGMFFNIEDASAYIGTFKDNKFYYGELFLLDPLIYYDSGKDYIDYNRNSLTYQQKKDFFDKKRRTHLKLTKK